jgi:hypothetical protein
MDLRADLFLTRGEDRAFVLRGDLGRVGTTADGYPEYASGLERKDRTLCGLFLSEI